MEISSTSPPSSPKVKVCEDPLPWGTFWGAMVCGRYSKIGWCYGPQQRIICDYRRSEKPQRQVSDWFEWQADVLAAAMLLSLRISSCSKNIHKNGREEASVHCPFIKKRTIKDVIIMRGIRLFALK